MEGEKNLCRPFLLLLLAVLVQRWTVRQDSFRGECNSMGGNHQQEHSPSGAAWDTPPSLPLADRRSL